MKRDVQEPGRKNFDFEICEPGVTDCVYTGMVNPLAVLLLSLFQDPSIAESIEQLGDESLEVRQRAEARLQHTGRAAVPALREAAMMHAEPEVRLRAASVVRYLTQVHWWTDLREAKQRAMEEKKPLFVFSTIGPLDGFC